MEEQIASYLSNQFGVSSFFTDWNSSLPWAVKHLFNVRSLEINNTEFMALLIKDGIEFNQDHLIAIRQVIDTSNRRPAIVIAGSISIQAERLAVKNRLAYIVPEKQCYIPQFLLHKRPYVVRDLSKTSRKLGVLSSMICMEYLEGTLSKTFTTADITIDASKAAISRAIQELEECSIIVVNRERKKHLLSFKVPRIKLWKYRSERLSILCSEPILVADCSNLSISGLSNLSALAHHSTLADPEIKHYAVVLSNQDRQGFPITDSTINSAGTTYLKKTNTPIANYDGETSNRYWIQVFPYNPKFESDGRECYLSPAFTALCAQANDPRTKNAIAGLWDKVTNKLIALDDEDAQKQ